MITMPTDRVYVGAIDLSGKYWCPHALRKRDEWGWFGRQPARVCRRPQCKAHRVRAEQARGYGQPWLGFSGDKLRRNQAVLDTIAECNTPPIPIAWLLSWPKEQGLLTPRQEK